MHTELPSIRGFSQICELGLSAPGRLIARGPGPCIALAALPLRYAGCLQGNGPQAADEDLQWYHRKSPSSYLTVGGA